MIEILVASEKQRITTEACASEKASVQKSDMGNSGHGGVAYKNGTHVRRKQSLARRFGSTPLKCRIPASGIRPARQPLLLSSRAVVKLTGTYHKLSLTVSRVLHLTGPASSPVVFQSSEPKIQPGSERTFSGLRTYPHVNLNTTSPARCASHLLTHSSFSRTPPAPVPSPHLRSKPIASSHGLARGVRNSCDPIRSRLVNNPLLEPRRNTKRSTSDQAGFDQQGRSRRKTGSSAVDSTITTRNGDRNGGMHGISVFELFRHDLSDDISPLARSLCARRTS